MSRSSSEYSRSRSRSSSRTKMEALTELMTLCNNCSSRFKQYFCLEVCCQPATTFCKVCEGDHHFLHRTNELRTLLCRRVNTNRHTVEQTYLVESLEDLTEEVQKIIQRCHALAEACQTSLKQAHDLPQPVGEKWYESFYETVKLYRKGRLSLRVAKARVERATSGMNFHEHKTLQLPTLSEIFRLFERVQNAVNDFSRAARRIKTATPTKVDGVLSDLNTQIQELAIQQYISFPLRDSQLDNQAWMWDRSFQCWSSLPDIRYAQRLKVLSSDNTKPSISKSSLEYIPILKELSTSCVFDALPDTLKLLELKNWAGWQQNMAELPDGLMVLNVDLTDKKGSSLKQENERIEEILSVDLTCLANLKHVTIKSKSLPERGQLSELVKLARIQNLRSMAVLAKDGLGAMEFLALHSMIYRKMLLRSMAFEKRQYLRLLSFSCKDYMLEALMDFE